MTEIVAVTSAHQIVNSQLLDRTTMVPMLNRAAILCDHIYFETVGLGTPGGEVERRAISVMFGGDAKDSI